MWNFCVVLNSTVKVDSQNQKHANYDEFNYSFCEILYVLGEKVSEKNFISS